MTAAPLTTPAVQAVHAINEVLMILSAACQLGDQPLHAADAERLRELLEPVLEDVAALQQYIERQEENLATMAEESLETHRALSDVNRRLGIAHQELEQLYIGASMDMERHTTRFNTVVRLRSLLDASAVTVAEPQSPRTAAAGR